MTRIRAPIPHEIFNEGYFHEARLASSFHVLIHVFSLESARNSPFRFRVLEVINRIALSNLFDSNEQTNIKRLSRGATFFSTLVLSLKLGGEPCIYHDDGEYPHPTSCGKYLVCYNHQAFEASCPSYLWFNDDTKQCDSPGNTKCSSKLTPLYSSP